MMISPDAFERLRGAFTALREQARDDARATLIEGTREDEETFEDIQAYLESTSTPTLAQMDAVIRQLCKVALLFAPE
jgi:hypothetical protein